MWINQSCFSLEFLSPNSLWKLFTFHGYKGIYSRVWDGMWKVTFQHNGVYWRVSLQLGWVASYQTRPDCIFCPIMIQLSWPFIFLHASHVCFILVSHQSRVSRESNHESPSCCTLLIKSSHSHTQFLHYSHLNTRFLNAELQVNLACT